VTDQVLHLKRRRMLSALGVCCIAWSSRILAQGVIMDFTLPATMRDCWIVNDGVMGGVSQSGLRHDPQGMIFEGQVSLENNGGFASMRSPARFERETQVLDLTTRGDGKRYKLMLRTEAAVRVTYESDFVSEATWHTHRFTTSQFIASFRGRSVQAPPLSFSDVIELGILIADKQEGSFRLQLKTIKSL